MSKDDHIKRVIEENETNKTIINKHANVINTLNNNQQLLLKRIETAEQKLDTSEKTILDLRLKVAEAPAPKEDPKPKPKEKVDPPAEPEPKPKEKSEGAEE